MKAFLLYLVAGMFFVLLQTSLFPLLLPAWLQPNLLLILVLYLGLSENLGRATFVTLLLGGIQDSFCGTGLGLYTSVNLAILLLVRMFSEQLNAESPPLLLLLISVGTLVQSLLVGFCLTTFAEAGPVMHLLFAALPMELVANLLAGAIMLFLFLRFQPLLGTRSGLAGLIYQSKRHGS